MLGLRIRHRVRGAETYFSLIESWPDKDNFLAFLGIARTDSAETDGFWRSVRWRLGSARLNLDGVTVTRLLADIAQLLAPAATVEIGAPAGAPPPCHCGNTSRKRGCSRGNTYCRSMSYLASCRCFNALQPARGFLYSGCIACIH